MDFILDIINNIDVYILPDTCIPIHQIISSFGFGLLFGALHTTFLWSFVSYLYFEYLWYISTRKRKYLYNWKVRLLAISMSILGILFSKTIWGYNGHKIFSFFY